ncbi:DMT family transporter [Roseibium sp. RKSG952]|uniref:DMT family transporter n=1 Tax=Roseibium sp. RKSG952 TaxID=2529384 RepID=UPI0012BBD822|nr:DMT family transporter [Roseibium sp. RKSG952]MTH97044.1 DMT family transporter [Roseibium sp. RKSG952]
MAYDSVHSLAPREAEAGQADTARTVRIPSLMLLLLVGAMLAVSAIFAKAAPALGWHPLILLLWSLFAASVLQLAYLLRDGPGLLAASFAEKRPGATRRLLIYMLVTGVLFAAPNAVAFAAAEHVGAGFVTLTFAFPLVLTYGLSLLLGLERLRIPRLIGVLFSLAGGGLFALGAGALNPSAGWWILLALTAPVFLTLGNLYRSTHWPAGASPRLLSAGMLTIGFGSLLALAAAMGLPLFPQHLSLAAVVVLVVQSIMFAVQYILYFQLQKQAGPVYLSQIGSVSAAFGIPLGLVLFHEVPSPVQIGALFLVLAGIMLVSRCKSEPSK